MAGSPGQVGRAGMKVLLQPINVGFNIVIKVRIIFIIDVARVILVMAKCKHKAKGNG